MGREPAHVHHSEQRDRHALDLARARRLAQREREHEQHERGGEQPALRAVRVVRHPQDAEPGEVAEARRGLEPLAAHHAEELDQAERDLERDEAREREPPGAREQDEERNEDQAAHDPPAQRPARGLGRPGGGLRDRRGCRRRGLALSGRARRVQGRAGSNAVPCAKHATARRRARAQSTRPKRRSRRW
jgi:hypothetical protein